VPEILSRGELAKTLWGELTQSQVCRNVLTVRMDNYKRGAWAKGWTLTAIHRPTGKRWASQYEFSLLEMQSSPSVVNRALQDAVLALATNLAEHLYSYDPRIGTLLSGINEPPMPGCPLFDRPDGQDLVQASAIRLKIASEGIPLQCPVCRERMNPFKAVVWGGGSLGWVHHECLKQLRPHSF
jgi:hypothetical protein